MMVVEYLTGWQKVAPGPDGCLNEVTDVDAFRGLEHYVTGIQL